MSYVDLNGNPTTDNFYFETAADSACPCRPRNATFYRTCALNPWVEKDVSGEVQKCIKATSGFICAPVKLASLRRDLSPVQVETYTPSCSFWDKLKAAVSSPACAAATLAYITPANHIAGAAGLPNVDENALASVNGGKCGCQSQHFAFKNDDARAYETLEASTNVNDLGLQLSDLMNQLAIGADINLRVAQTQGRMIDLQVNLTARRQAQVVLVHALQNQLMDTQKTATARAEFVRDAAQAQDQVIVVQTLSLSLSGVD